MRESVGYSAPLMIPPHGPSFGFGAIVAAAFSGTGRDLQQLEEAYAERADCPCAVWLPTARAGICWALRVAIREGAAVIAPAFTCGVVHEAIVRSGGKLEPVDIPETGFLVDEGLLVSGLRVPYALVLCEIYGHAYDLGKISAMARRPPMIRIIDMAMSVLHRGLFQSLEARDFAVISFGLGKSMYAGYGAMGFTRDSGLADRVKRLRDSAIQSPAFKSCVSRVADVSLRTALARPAINSVAKRLRSRRPEWNPSEVAFTGIPDSWLKGAPFAGALPSNRVDRGLAMWNLAHADALRQKRLDLARRYEQNLAGAKGIVLPASSPNALSHYTLRVPSASRMRLRQKLYDAGIATSSMWEFPSHLDKEQFPNAHRLSREVVSLPLSCALTPADVDRICERLGRSVEDILPRLCG